MDLESIHRTIRVTTLTGKRNFGRAEVTAAFLAEFPGVAEKLLAVWKMKSAAAWYLTFEDEDTVGKVLQSEQFAGSKGRKFAMSPWYRRCLALRVSWLPIWTSPQTLFEQLRMFVDVSEIAMEKNEGIMTGIRLIQVTGRENDLHKIPYSVECDGRTGLVSVPVS